VVADPRWTSTVVLGDGSSALIRPITPDDAPALADFHARQSADSRYFRFFTPKPSLTDDELHRFTNVDFVDRVALVVEEHGEFVAWASYERWKNRDDAEVAFMVDDDHQGKGIATLLLEHLAAIARANGIERFTAQTMGVNRSMLAVFARAGFPLQRRFESGVIDVDFEIEGTRAFVDSVERREQRADSRAMARLLLASTVAVIGASERVGTIGYELWRRLGDDPNRRVYAVNPRHATLGGHPSYASVVDVPDDVALAVIAVPAASLTTTIEQCITKRVRGAVIVTNVDGEPDVDITAIVAHARHNGLRIIGPSSVGIASPLPGVALQASVGDVLVPPGNVAISMQSGTLSSAVLRLAAQLRLPTSWFVSLGDKSDVSGNDLLQFWEDDEATGVIALYTETLGNARKFARIARRVSRSRPIVSVRTGAALTGDATDALYADTGVIQVPTVTALLDTARTLSTQPLMDGRRVAVLTNSASPGVLATVSLRAAGLDVVAAPVPLTWRSSQDDYRAAVSVALASNDNDALMVIHAPPLMDHVGEPSAAIDAACEGAVKPVVTVMLGSGNGPLREGSPIPSFAFPEQAAGVLGRLAAYSAWRRAELAHLAESPVDDTTIDVAAAAALIEREMALESDAVVDPHVVEALLECYGVRLAAGRLVDAADAPDVADQLGYPIAVKAAHRRVGRTIEAGVALDLVDRAAVERAVESMQATLGADAAHVYVQRMVPPGYDMRVRVHHDERFGPVVGVGLGGMTSALMPDETTRLAPVSPSSAMAMIAESRAASTLDENGADALADVIVRAAQLASDHPHVADLVLNPVIVSSDGCWVVDAVLRLRPATPSDTGMRRLEEA
jgi:acyl-CoA synthetase (NDP forming)/RimJ/RimL family protein N-acetyltransferase